MSQTKKRKSDSVAETPVEVATVTCCRNCGATNRTPYHNTVTHAIAGIHDGREYDTILYRRTSCGDCGQARVDKSYELRRDVS